MEKKAFVLLVLLGFFLSERALAAVPADVLSPEGTLEERERRIVEQVRQLAPTCSAHRLAWVPSTLFFSTEISAKTSSRRRPTPGP